MKVYRYGLERRPAQLGAVPKGFIPDPTSKPDPENHTVRHGWIDYPAPLSEEDVKSYELVIIGEIRRFDEETEYYTHRAATAMFLIQDKALRALAEGQPIPEEVYAELPVPRANLLRQIWRRAETE